MYPTHGKELNLLQLSTSFRLWTIINIYSEICIIQQKLYVIIDQRKLEPVMTTEAKPARKLQ